MADLTTAFLEGSRMMAKSDTTTLGNPVSIGNPVGTIGEYDPKTSPVYDTAASADKISGFGLKPGQKRGHYGTTVFMPKRNDPEVEAVLGEHTYKQKISLISADAMRMEQLELKNLIAKQQAQIEMLTTIVAGGKPDIAPEQMGMVTHPIATVVPPSVTTTNATGSVIDYRTIAKAAGIKTFGRKKDEVIAELKEKGLI